MPVLSSTRFSTTTGNSFLPSSYSSRLSTSSGTTSSLYSSNRQPQYRSSFTTSSGYGSRSDDSSRFGVSRYTSRSSFDKPPTGSSTTSRFRSESRSRDYSLDGSSGGAYSGYNSSSSTTKSDSNSYHNTKRQSPSSLARSVATSGADLYEKYSPSHYIPKCELSRSRSLSETTSSKLASADISTRSLLRSASRDRDTSAPVNSSALTSKVKKSVPSLATHNCSTFNSLHPSSNNNNLTEPPAVVTAAVTNTKSNNPKVFICSNSHSTATSVVGLKNSQTKKATAVVVNSSAVGKKSLVSNSPNSVVRNSHSNVTDSMFNNNNHNNIINNNNNNSSSSSTTTSQSKSSEFLKIAGVRPLTVDRSFLRHECELARSQVVCSGLTVKSRDSSPNHTLDVRQNRRPIKPLVHQTNISISLKSDAKKSDELNNNNSNMNCLQKSPDLLDDIKYIDSDDSERKNSPTISKITTSREYFNGHISSTLPPPTTVKIPIEAAGVNKYNTLTNPRSVGGHENGLSNGGKRFFGTENGSRSSSPAARLINKRNDETATDKQKLSGDVSGSIRNTSLRSLPPSSSSSPSSSNRYWDREGRSTLSNRNLSDSDAFNKSLASSSLSDVSDDSSDGLCGLRNIGNTCFMNSVIQCLSHTSELTRFLKTKTDGRSTTKDQRILVEFAKLIRDMWTPNTRSVTPSELKSAFSCKHRMYSGCQQQDAQEFLRFFLDSLHSACNTGTKGGTLEIDDNLSDNKKADLTWEWYTKVENSMIKDLFVGQLKSTLKCTQCGNTSVTFDPFWDLSVPLPSSSKCKLESCLDLFIKEEVLDGDEMPTCSKCKTRRKSTKTFTIQRFPKYLAIHLKRFSETRWSKLSNIVEIPTGERELNMAPYAANSSSALYSLYGISNHMGSTAGGHYVALCKHPVTKKWHEFNDNMVHDASESGLVSSSAYLLFYERAEFIKLNSYSMHQPHNQRHYRNKFPKPIYSNLSDSIYNYVNCHADGPATNRHHQHIKLLTTTDSVSNTTQSMTSQFEFMYHAVLGIIFYLSCLVFYVIVIH